MQKVKVADVRTICAPICSFLDHNSSLNSQMTTKWSAKLEVAKKCPLKFLHSAAWRQFWTDQYQHRLLSWLLKNSILQNTFYVCNPFEGKFSCCSSCNSFSSRSMIEESLFGLPNLSLAQKLTIRFLITVYNSVVLVSRMSDITQICNHTRELEWQFYWITRMWYQWRVTAFWPFKGGQTWFSVTV